MVEKTMVRERLPELPTRPILLTRDETARMESVLEQDITVAMNATSKLMETITEWRKCYLPTDETEDPPMFPGASTLKDPFVKSTTNAIMASLAPATLGTDPLFHFQGYGESHQYEDEVENAIHHWYTYEMEARKTLRTFEVNGLRDGSAVLYHGWETIVKPVYGYRKETEIVDDGMVGVEAEVEKHVYGKRLETVYDGPMLQVIPRENFFYLPSQDVDLNTAGMVGHTVSLTGLDLMRYAESGACDKARVQELLAWNPAEKDIATAEDERDEITQAYPSTTADPDKQLKTYDIYMILRRYQSPGDPYACDWSLWYERDTKKLLRARPYTYNMRPYAIVRPYSDTAGMNGESVASVGGKDAQDAKSAMRRLAVNMGLRRVNPRFIVPASQYKELKEKLRDIEALAETGAIIPIDDVTYEKVGGSLRPIELAGDVPGSLLALINDADLNGQRATFANDTSKGIAVGSMTATQAAQIMQAMKEGIAILTERTSEALQDSCQIVFDMLRQHLDRPYPQRVWKMVNSDSDVDYFDAMLGDYIITANGSTTVNNQALRAQHVQDILTVAASIPEIWMNPRYKYQIVSRYFQEHGVRDARDSMGTVEEWVKFQEQMSQGGEGEATDQAAMAKVQVDAEKAKMDAELGREKVALEAKRIELDAAAKAREMDIQAARVFAQMGQIQASMIQMQQAQAGREAATMSEESSGQSTAATSAGSGAPGAGV